MKKRTDTEPAKGDAVYLDGGYDEHTVVQIFNNDRGQRVARIEEIDSGKARIVDLYRIKLAD